jgi:hypothetical protein
MFALNMINVMKVSKRDSKRTTHDQFTLSLSQVGRGVESVSLVW